MRYPNLIPGTLLKRYKRFLTDIQLENGEIVVAHCVNTGSMKTCSKPNSKVFLSTHNNPKRKLKFTLEMIKSGRSYIGINTILANKLVKEALEKKQIKELKAYDQIKTEVKYSENSRVDLLLRNDSLPDCYVEVKNVSMAYNHVAYFPDGVSARALKHLKDLQLMVKAGHKAIIFFLIQRSDISHFKPAGFIDPAYANGLIEAQKNGVEILCYKCKVTSKENIVTDSIPWSLDYPNNPEIGGI